MRLTLLFALVALAAAAIAASPPNVILIVSDDQGYPDLGCIGSKPFITPNLDRLATAVDHMTEMTRTGRHA